MSSYGDVTEEFETTPSGRRPGEAQAERGSLDALPEARYPKPDRARPGGRIGDVNRDDIEAFAARDWGLVEQAKRRFWSQRKRTLSPGEALAIAEGLRLHVRALRPDWPSAKERAEDLEVHVRVAASLRRVR